MNGWLVYVHINKTNHKRYFGITSRKPEVRFGKQGCCYKQCPCFYAAIQKYGWNNFEHKVLIHGLTETQAKVWETKLITKYKTNINTYGYNLTDGGDGQHHVEATKEIIRQGKLGEKNPNYGKCGKLNTFYGKKHSAKSRESMSKNNWSKKHTGSNSPNARAVISLLDNKTFGCVNDCVEYYKLHRKTVREHLQGKRKYHLFMYLDEYEANPHGLLYKPVKAIDGWVVSSDGVVVSCGNNAFVLQRTDLNGYRVVKMNRIVLNKVVQYHCIAVHLLVAHAFLPNPHNYSEVIHLDGNKQNNKVENLAWDTTSKQIISDDIEVLYNRRVYIQRKVARTDMDGNILAVYNSAKQTARDGFIESCVRGVCTGKHKHHKGFKFKYIDDNQEVI